MADTDDTRSDATTLVWGGLDSDTASVCSLATDESSLYDHMSASRIQVFIKSLDNWTTTSVNIHASDTIDTLKRCISGIPPSHQKLIFYRHVLMNSKTVKDYDIKMGDTIHVTDMRDIQVFVKTIKGKTVVIPAVPSLTVDKLMKRIESKVGIPANQMRLIFHLYQLENGRTLSDYNIQNNSTLFLLLGLRGGMNNGHHLIPKKSSGSHGFYSSQFGEEWGVLFFPVWGRMGGSILPSLGKNGNPVIQNLCVIPFIRTSSGAPT